MSFRVEAELPIPARQLFLERDSAAFRALLSKSLKIGQLEFSDLWREGGSTYVRMITKPEFGSWVPKAVANQLQQKELEFHDVIEYNPRCIASPPYTLAVRTESPFLKDKLDVQLTLTIEELEGGASCRQILEGCIRVRMFGVGRIVERIVKESLQNTYKKLPEIVRRWQLYRQEALLSGDERQLLLGRPPVGCEVAWIRQDVLQILKEPLPGNGSATPVSALSPLPDASEASEDSHAMLQHLQAPQAAQQHAAPGAAAGDALGGPQQGAPADQRQQEAEAVCAEEVLQGGRRTSSVAMSDASLYFDARESWQAAKSMRFAAAASAANSRQQRDAAAADTQALGLGGGAFAGVEQPPQQQQETQASHHSVASLAAVALSRGPHHRRAVSDMSAASADTPAGGDDGGTPGGDRHQHTSRRFWSRFNRHYGEWESYWKEMGVEPEEEGAEEAGAAEGRGIVSQALHAAEEVLRSSYYAASLVLALFFLRTGYLRVEPQPDADPHDERTRQHAGHRHTRLRSSSSSGGGGGGGGRDGGTDTATATTAGTSSVQEADDEQPPRAQSLARVAQIVGSRMVWGSKAVCQAPVRAAMAAGSGLAAARTSMRQATSSSWAELFASKPSSAGACARSSADGRSADGGSRRGSAAATQQPAWQQQQQEPLPWLSVASGAAVHRKSASLDSGTSAAAQRAAAAAVLAQEAQRQQQLAGGGAGAAAAAPCLPAHISPMKALQRRPSNMAAVAAMESSQRGESQVQSGGRRARKHSCFAACTRQPAVKE
ncbi:hypothetical protein D9Q98_000979 [Chlorella vulgaris]|uniref:Uncharacterized protein n=1 Tax=Chlorella vulgaris TaxID=3077 RepID=A0A9D4Z2V8_CHLVU|nr:hypothetical protein D9Q98_000979 [Chlorella vulgaris]